jgi:hypothetical protein
MYHDTKMSRSRLQYLEQLGKTHVVINDGPGFPNFTSARISVTKYNPDLVIWYKPTSIPGFALIPDVPKVLIYNEMYRVKEVTAEIINSGTKIMICHHANDINKFSLPSVYKFYHIPHHIDTTVFYDRGKKDIDILLAGILAANIYPFRSRLAKILHSGALKKYRCVHYKHPGYRINDPSVQLNRFAEYLSRAKIVLTCSSVYKYALAKYPEIMASGSVVAGDIPDERQAWFKGHIIDLTSLTDKQIVDRISYYLSDPMELIKLSEYGKKDIADNFTMEHWVKKFEEIIDVNI